MHEIEHGKPETVNLTVRLQPMHGLMLKTLSRALDFPISSTLTDLISHQINDALMNLEGDDVAAFENFVKEHHLFENPRLEGVLDKHGIRHRHLKVTMDL